MVSPHGLKPCAAPQSPEVPPTYVSPQLRGHLRGPRWICDRPLRGDEFGSGCDRNGSRAPVQTVTERSVAQLTPRRLSPTTAPPLNAVARTSEVSSAEEQLVGSQREFARRRRPAAIAAKPSKVNCGRAFSRRAWPTASGVLLPRRAGLPPRCQRRNFPEVDL